MPDAGGPSSGSSSSASITQTLLTYPSTQQGRVVIAALASCTVTAASIFSYQAGVRAARRRKLAKDVDKATHRDQDVQERKSHLHHHQQQDSTETESVDGGTPRYLSRLSRLGNTNNLSSPRSNGNLRASVDSPLRRENSRQSVTTAKTSSREDHPTTSYDDSLIREQLARNFAFLGDDAMKNLKDAFVIVVGLGGVGSHTALSLIRSGVGHVRLIDFDQVSLSSLNRHAVATLDDVGRPKVVVCQEHFKAIAPWVHIQAWVEIFNESDAARLFSPFRVPGKTFGSSSGKEIPPTYVVDCIDNLNTKVGLLAYCHNDGIKIFSSMGASAKCDPTRICIGDLTATEEDPLAKSVRRRLRERGIPQVPPKEPAQPQKPPKQKKQPQPGTWKQRPDKRNDKAGTSTPPRKEADTSDDAVHSTPRPANQNQFRKPSPPPPREQRRLSRASSASSFGSGEGVFYTPQGTPKEEERDWNGDRPDELELDQKIEEAAQRDEEERQESHPGESHPPSPSGSLQVPPHRPTMSHHSSSGLEVLDASPIQEKSAPPFSIESTPGFAPTSAEDAEADVSNSTDRPGQIWKRESSRRRSEGPQAEAHQSNNRRPRLDTPEELSPAEEENEILAPAKPVASPAPAPWTSSNPQYLIPCIFSTEKPAVDLLPLDEAELAKDGGVEMLRALEDGNEWRVRVLPVLGPIPAIFGLSIATYIICDVSGRSDLMEPLQSKMKRRTAERTQKELEASERQYPSPGSNWSASKQSNPHSSKGRNSPFLLDDILYLCHEVFHSRSVVPPFVALSGGCLLRWDSTLPLSFSNVALFSREEAKKHVEEVLKRGRSPVEVWGEDAAEMWRRRMKEERWYSRFR